VELSVLDGFSLYRIGLSCSFGGLVFDFVSGYLCLGLLILVGLVWWFAILVLVCVVGLVRDRVN